MAEVPVSAIYDLVKKGRILMARTIDSAKRVLSGVWGEIWLDGEKVAECTACQLRVSKNKQTINLCGQFMADSKATSGSGTGSLTLYKVDSGLIEKQADLQDGVDRRFTIVSKLRDPDGWGAERVAAYNVSFDDLTLADWRAATVGTVTAAFTFSRYELLDQIEVR